MSTHDYPVMGRDLKAVRDQLVGVVEATRTLTNEVNDLRADLVPGMRSRWLGRLVLVGLLAGFSGGAVGGCAGAIGTAAAKEIVRHAP